jgi:hypothetical protein
MPILMVAILTILTIHQILYKRDLMTNNETVRFITGGTLDINLYRGEHSDLQFVAKAGSDHYTPSSTVIFPKNCNYQIKV